MKKIEEKSFLTSNNENTIQKKDSKGISHAIEINLTNKNENNSNYPFQKKISENISTNTKALSAFENIIQKKYSNALNSNKLGASPESGRATTQTIVSKTSKIITSTKYELNKATSINTQNKYSRANNSNSGNYKTEIQNNQNNNYNYKVNTRKYTVTNNKTTNTITYHYHYYHYYYF